MIQLFLIIGFLFLVGCSDKAQPIEDKQVQEQSQKHATGHIDTH